MLCRLMRRSLPLFVVLCCLLLGVEALAHGPTVRLSYNSVAPEQLVIRAGQTVHFVNASATPRSFTLQAEDGSFESPALDRGEGWHYEFPEAGSFQFGVAEFSDMRGVIIVAPAEP
jgi:plastocyanin